MSVDAVTKAARRRPQITYLLCAALCLFCGYMLGVRDQPQRDFSKLDKEYLNSYEDWGMHVQMLGDKPRTEGYYQVAT